MVTSISLNGVDVTADTVGLSEFIITYALNTDNKTVTKAITNQYGFEGEGYTLLKSIFIDDEATGEDQTVSVELKSDCCSRTFDFVIKPELIEYCPYDKMIRSTLIQDNADTKAYRCLNNKVYHSDKNGVPFKDGMTFLKFKYGLDYGFMQVGVTILYYMAFGTFALLSAVQAIVNFLAGTFGFDPPDIPFTLADMRRRITGTGKYHVGTRIFDLFQKNCEQCGVTFKSSIFESGTYANTTLLDMVTDDGTDNDVEENNANYFDYENAAALGVFQIGDELQKVFNSEYELRNLELILERRDFFDIGVETILNIDDVYKAGKAQKPCYKFARREQKAYARLSYSTDFLDTEGSRLVNGNLSENPESIAFADIIEWNQNNLDNRNGVFEVNNSFTPARFDDDIKTRNFYKNLRSDLGFENALVMTGGVAANLKLLIWDGLDALDAKVVKRVSTLDSSRFDFNHPLSINANYEDSELYQNFWAIEAPDAQNVNKFELEPFETFPEDFCFKSNLIDQHGTRVLLENNDGYAGRPKEIEVNFTNGTITYTGVLLKKI